MKKQLLIALFSFILSINVNAQFGGLINKGKQLNEKKKEEKKIEEKQNTSTNSSSTVTTNNANNPTSSSNNASTTTSETKQTEANATVNNNSSIETKTQKRFQDDGFTSEAHKINVGKVVFSKKQIEKGNEKTEDFISEVSGNDLYLRFYLENSFYNTSIFPTYQYGSQEPKNNSLCSYYIEVLIDGIAIKDIPELTSIGIKPHLYEETDTYEMSHNQNNEQKLARIKATTNALSFGQWPLFANYMKPGEHIIKLNVWAGSEGYAAYKSKEPVASGEFKYTKKAGDKIPFGVAWSSVAKKPEMIDANLQAQIKQTIEEDTKVKCLKLIIIDKEWTIFKNSFGIIESRQISVQYVAKDSNGYCTEEYAGMAQNYSNGKYGRMRATGASSNEGPVFIDCATVK